MFENWCQRSAVARNNSAWGTMQKKRRWKDGPRLSETRRTKAERCNDVLGNESSGSIASAICSTEKIVRHRGWRLKRVKRKEGVGARDSFIRRGIMRASLIVSLLMFARFRASFSSGHFSRIRVSGFAWLITINKYPASAWDTVPREKEITSCRGFCYNHGETGGEPSRSISPWQEGATGRSSSRGNNALTINLIFKFSVSDSLRCNRCNTVQCTSTIACLILHRKIGKMVDI